MPGLRRNPSLGAFCQPACMSELEIVDIPEEDFDDLASLWHVLYDHHNEVTPHLRIRSRPFAQA